MDKKTKNNAAPKPATPPTAIPENTDLTNVDKIRDILFGNQMRDYDRKFNQLEERIANDLSTLRKESALQIESLQTFLQSEIMGSKLASEAKTRVSEMDDMDALIHKRVYKKEMSVDDAIEIMSTGRGTHFDPDLFDLFLRLKGEVIEITRLNNEYDC